MRIAVIADDLTGALDTGVQFRQWGYSVELTDTPKNSTAEVVIINTDTRNTDPETAYHLTYHAARKISDRDIIYKKSDSTLRGYPGQELQAILDATNETKAIITPTYPPTLRRVKDGHLYIGDKLITETEYINEYHSPQSYIPNILSTETPITHIKTPEQIPQMEGILVIDSETEYHLKEIVKAAKNTRILAGSAGLADALCLTLRDPPPVLTLIGSMRTETRKQVKELENRLNATIIPLDTIKALHRAPQTETIIQAKQTLDQNMDAVITSTHTPEIIEKTRQEAERLNITPQKIETRITEALAEATQALHSHRLSGIIITGGATALAITKRLGTSKIEILDEVQPGIPVLRLDHLPAITKAGGFGAPDALIQSTQYLKRKQR